MHCRKNLKDWCSNVKFYLQTAGGFIRMLIFTSAVVAAPMLLEEMVDPVANMLNYFLKHLTGSERAKLKVKNPEKVRSAPTCAFCRRHRAAIAPLFTWLSCCRACGLGSAALRCTRVDAAGFCASKTWTHGHCSLVHATPSRRQVYLGQVTCGIMLKLLSEIGRFQCDSAR